MAITEDKNDGTTPTVDGDSYDAGTLGTDAGLVSGILYRDSVSSATSSDFQYAGTNFVQDVSILEVALLSFDMYFTSGSIISGSISSGSNTFDAQISTGATAEGGVLATLAGMLQSGTITDDAQLTTFASASLPGMTYTIADGDILYTGYESNGGTLTAPPDASSGDSYTEIYDGAMTGSPLTQGKIHRLIATADMTSESLGGSLTGSNSGSRWLFIIKASAAAGVTVALTGVSTAYSIDSVANAVSKALTGNQGAFSVGTVSVGAGVTLALTGNQGTYSLGTLANSTDNALTGNQTTYSVDSVGVSVSNAITGNQTAYSVESLGVSTSKALTGVSTSYNAGNLTNSLSVGMTGVSTAYSVGTMLIAADLTLALTGVQGAYSVGDVTVFTIDTPDCITAFIGALDSKDAVFIGLINDTNAEIGALDAGDAVFIGALDADDATFIGPIDPNNPFVGAITDETAFDGDLCDD